MRAWAAVVDVTTVVQLVSSVDTWTVYDAAKSVVLLVYVFTPAIDTARQRSI